VTAGSGAARRLVAAVPAAARATAALLRPSGGDRLAFLRSFAPLECALCEAPIAAAGRPFCDPCAVRLPWWRRADGCPRCGMPVDPGRPGSAAGWGGGSGRVAPCPACLAAGSPLHLCRAATCYVDPLTGLVPAFKNPRGPFGPRPPVARAVDYLADELARMLGATVPAAALPDRVVPIPLHAARRNRRGFNHADRIARRVARGLGVPLDAGLLARVRDTGSQAGRSARARREALRGAFRVRGQLPAPGLRIALVDDVLTTGSTLEAAAEALLAAGAAEVWGLTLSATRPTRRAAAAGGPYARGARTGADAGRAKE